MFSIYKIRHLDSDKIYIGFTSLSPEQRFYLHLKDAHLGSKSHLHHALAKYGKEAFEIETIYISKDKEHTLETMEPFFIREYREAGYTLYNIQPGGRGYKDNPRSKKVELYDSDLNLVKTLPSQSATARELGCDLSTVIAACQNADNNKASKLKGYWACFQGSKPIKKDTSYLLERNRKITPFKGKKRPDHSLKMMGNQNARKKPLLTDTVAEDPSVDSSRN